MGSSSYGGKTTQELLDYLDRLKEDLVTAKKFLAEHEAECAACAAKTKCGKGHYRRVVIAEARYDIAKLARHLSRRRFH